MGFVQLIFGIIAAYPKVALPIIVSAALATYFHFITGPEIAIAIGMFFLGFLLLGIFYSVIGFLPFIRLSDKVNQRILASMLVISSIVTISISYYIRQLPPLEERIAERQAKLEEHYLANYQPSEILQEIVDRAGLSEKAIRRLFLTDPEILSSKETVRMHCDHANSQHNINLHGCFRVSGKIKKIYLLNSKDSAQKDMLLTTATHELLHALYYEMTFDQKKSLNLEIEKELHGKNSIKIKKRLGAYADIEESKRYNELYAILGTEFENLSPELENHYEEYFSRAKILASFNAAWGRLHKYENDLQKRDAALSSLAKEITLEKRILKDFSEEASRLRVKASGLYADQITIDEYNEMVREIKDQNDKVNKLILAFNKAVSDRNLIANRSNQVSRSMSN